MNNQRTSTDQTFVMIKPDGIQRSLIGEIISRFEKSGLKLVAIKMIVPDVPRLTEHYGKSDEWCEAKGQRVIENMLVRGEKPTKEAIEYGRDITHALVDYMSAGPAILMVWEGNRASAVVKKLVGDTEPYKSDVGTLRGDYTLDSYEKANLDGRAVRNLIHCTDPADGPDEVGREIGIWFDKSEILSYRLVSEDILYNIKLSGIL